jgi:hypothetical protein
VKKCSRCGEEKPLDEFHKLARSRDGLRCECKTCKAARYQKNREAILAQRAAWRAAHPEKIAARDAAYREAHPEKIAAYRAARRATAEGWATNALSGAKKRAKKRGVPCTITIELLLLLRARAIYCPALKRELKYGGGPLAPNSATLDCIDPALGYIPGNVVIMSFRANTIKQDATAEELRQVADFVKEITPLSRAKIAANSVSDEETVLDCPVAVWDTTRVSAKETTP